LARLEAGREQLNVTAFDVSTELGGLCESLQPLAASRRLSLKFAAPGALVVDGDAVKVRRIAQNLGRGTTFASVFPRHYSSIGQASS